MAYTHTTLTTARGYLAAKLGDTGNVFWTANELDYATREAIRLLNCATGFHRVRTSFTTAADQSIYDLTTTSGPTTYLSRTVTFSDLIKELQVHLLEPVTGTSWTGTAMFTLADVTQALVRRINMFLVDTLAVMKHASITVTTPLTDGRVDALDEDYVYFQRVAWKSPLGKYTTMWPQDELVTTAARRSWNTQGNPPYAWSVVASPQLSIQLIPHVLSSGTLDAIVLELPASPSDVSTDTITVPDDYVWAVKYGALSDLLGRDGPASDPYRAEWAEEMYQLGVRLARKHPVILASEIAGQPLIMSNLQTLDATRPGWQGKPVNTPDKLAAVGLNLVAVANVPRSSGVTVELDIVAKATVPAVGSGAQLQIRQDQVEAVLQWAEHIALLKCGGQEFKASALAGKRLFEIADRYTNQQISNSQYLAEMYGLQTSTSTFKTYERTEEQLQSFSTSKEQALIERLKDSHGRV